MKTRFPEKDKYLKFSDALMESPDTKRFVIGAQRAITGMVFAIYPMMLAYVYMAATSDAGLYTWIQPADMKRFLLVLLVPAAGLVLISVLRRIIDEPRPYEVYGVEPLVFRRSKGKSFPSRHSYSVFIIAMVAGVISPVLLGVLLACGVFLMYSRVAMRVHFIRDVAVGAAIGIALGFLMYL